MGVGIIILNKSNEILLLLRNEDALLADSDMRLEGTYTLPSGKVNFGETFEVAAVRKTKDESNIDINIKDLQVVSLANDNEYTHYATIGLLATKYTGEFKLKDSGEFSGYGWFKLDKLPTNLCIPSIKIINNYLNKIIYSDDIKVRKLTK